MLPDTLFAIIGDFFIFEVERFILEIEPECVSIEEVKETVSFDSILYFFFVKD